MGYGWEPKWIRKKIVISEGIEIETCYDAVTGLYLCPICVNVSKVCPSYTEYSSAIPEKATYFFSIDDLLHHIKAHTKIDKAGYQYVEAEEGEEEEEIEEE